MQELEGLSAEELERLSAEELERLSGEELEGLSAEELEGLSAEELERLSGEELEGLRAGSGYEVKKEKRRAFRFCAYQAASECLQEMERAHMCVTAATLMLLTIH